MIKIYLFLFLSSIVSLSYANYLDDWTDEDLCRWMDAALIPEHISEEIYTRKTICFKDFEAIELTSQPPILVKMVLFFLHLSLLQK